MTKPTPAQAIIETREATHGDYGDQAATAQIMKDLFRHSRQWDKMQPHHRETLDMIAVKLARIVTGNPEEPDHWLDVAGYATLSYNLATTGKGLGADKT